LGYFRSLFYFAKFDFIVSNSFAAIAPKCLLCLGTLLLIVLAGAITA
jgi:hypothetical protein